MNPNLLAAIIDGTAQRFGLIFPGVVDPHGVIYFIDGGSSAKNNRCTVSLGGVFARKNAGSNRFVDTSNILENRFDDYQYYERVGS